jgi:hypothetical protein
MAGPPVGKTIYPGEEFDAYALVAGCVPVDDESSGEDGTPPGDGKPAAKGRSNSKESGS